MNHIKIKYCKECGLVNKSVNPYFCGYTCRNNFFKRMRDMITAAKSKIKGLEKERDKYRHILKKEEKTQK